MYMWLTKLTNEYNIQVTYLCAYLYMLMYACICVC